MASYESPFAALDAPSLSTISASCGFQILRKYLSVGDDHSCFCEDHASVTDKDTVVLHRDIVHALIMPIVQVFQRASALAHAVLCSQNPEDLELAFRGEARDAFVWLQVFIGEEEQWCYTQGCPACIVSNTLSTESTVRAAITAALMSSIDQPCLDKHADPSEPNVNRPSLPDFSALLPSLQLAVANDEFWGSTFYEHFFDRAQRTYCGLQDLISQCANLEVLVTSQPSSPLEMPSRHVSTNTSPDLIPSRITPPLNAENTAPSAGAPTYDKMRLQRGHWAKRQSSLEQQERDLLLLSAWESWSAQQARYLAQARQQPWLMEPELRQQVERRKLQGCWSGLERGPGERRRSLTCP